MVFLELAIGKGAALSGLLKMSAVGGSGKGATALVAVPAVAMDSFKVLPAAAHASITGFGHHLLSIATGAVGALSEIERTSLGLLTTTAGLYSMMQTGLFAAREGDDSSDEKESIEDARVSMWAVPMSLRFCALTDCCMAGIVVHSLGQPLAVPLRMWVLGGLVLSFPMSKAVRAVVEEYGFREGFILESGAVVAGVAWLSWGSSLLLISPHGVHTAPLLWWSCFGQCVLLWSCTSAVASAMLLTTVLSLLPVFVTAPP
uniref:Uncharacterized protein n=1 Tax=Alexandrium catenella TaxID=2925 RepID=A0A7S1S028_ALECA